ncbi:hypothetical protein HT031_005088 [Scenedesmus sp. PABB004]|nr:hypothetical protein HT031_005088 [Scenedesmus sp. PABB004]
MGKRRAPPPRSELDELAQSDSEPEAGADDFAAGADRVALAGREPESDGLDEQAIYDLSDDEDEDGSDDEGEDGSGEGEEDDEELLEQALAAGGKSAQLAKQARFLEQRLRLQAGESSDDGDDDAPPAGPGLRERLWGANKRAYYQDGDAEGSDEEAAAAEEEEVRRLQAQALEGAADDDYALPGAAAPGTRRRGAGGAAEQQQQQQPGGVAVEAVEKDLASLTAEQQLAVVMADAPELLSLLEELKACLAEVRGRVGPLLREVGGGGLATAAGLSYLEAKHLLLLQYAMCIVAYLMLKAEGRPVQDHPVIGRLVQLRAYLERVRPIDKQLAYQIDKLLRATAAAQASADADGAGAGAGAAGGGDDDALRHRPRPGRLIPKAPLPGDAAAAEAGVGVYRPPRLNPTAMEEDRALSGKEMRRLREAQRRAQRSSAMRELAAELAGAPDEVRDEQPGFDSAAAVAARQRLEARAAEEEELMLRVPLSKAEARKLKAQRRAGLSGAAGLTDFADDVADLVAASGGGGGGLGALLGKQRAGQQFGADLASLDKGLRSGDADLIPRKPISERRAAFDATAARRAAAAGGGFDDDDDGGGGGGGGRKRAAPAGEEDETYAEAKAARAAAKAAKRAKHAAPGLAPPLADPAASGQRKITYEIEKNRGLTPHRRKDLKNPRKKHRIKYADAVVRRKGQVAGVRDAPSAPRGYAGDMWPETAALAAWLGRCARASSVDALAAEGAAGQPLLVYFGGLTSACSGSPCADLRALLAAGVQARLAQAVARAVEQLAAPATRLAAAGSVGFTCTLNVLCKVLDLSFVERGALGALGAPLAELAAEVVNSGMLPPLAAACAAHAAELEAQVQQQQQQPRRQGGSAELAATRLAVFPLLTAAYAARKAWPTEGQLEGPPQSLAQPVARLALAVLRCAGAWRADGPNPMAHLGNQFCIATLTGAPISSVNVVVQPELDAARKAAWFTAQSVVLAQERGSVTDVALRVLLSDPAVQQLLLANLALRAAHLHKAQRGRPAATGGDVGPGGGAPAVPARHAALLRALELDAAAVPPGDQSEALVMSSTNAVAILFDVSPPTSCGGSLPQPRGAGLAAAAAEVALELVALQPTRRVLMCGVRCAGNFAQRLWPASEGGAQDDHAAAVAAASAVVVRAFLPLARPVAAALLEPAAGSSPCAAAAAANTQRVDEPEADLARANDSALIDCARVLMLSYGAEARAALVAFARQDPSTLCRLLEASTRSWVGRGSQRGTLSAAHALCDAIRQLGPSLAAAPALATTGGGAGLRLQREVFPCLLTALNGARAAGVLDEPMLVHQHATAADMAADLHDAAALLGTRLRALGSLPADASRAGLEPLLAQQEQLCAASVELAAQLAIRALEAAASLPMAQERGPALAAQAEELCTAVCAALPLRACCNPRCAALAGAHSELAAVRGRGTVCGGCGKSAAPARFCSRACQTAAWRAHKPVCRALAAGVARAPGAE